jgi:hypothetical protein
LSYRGSFDKGDGAVYFDFADVSVGSWVKGSIPWSDFGPKTFESCRVRQNINDLAECPDVRESKTHHKLTNNMGRLARNRR